MSAHESPPPASINIAWRRVRRVENIAFGVGGLLGFDSWSPIVVIRGLGAAVRPPASVFVLLGWWEPRNAGGRSRLAWNRLIAGVGVHAAWNGSLVVESAAGIAFDDQEVGGSYAVLSLAYTGVIGLPAAGHCGH